MEWASSGGCCSDGCVSVGPLLGGASGGSMELLQDDRRPTQREPAPVRGARRPAAHPVRSLRDVSAKRRRAASRRRRRSGPDASPPRASRSLVGRRRPSRLPRRARRVPRRRATSSGARRACARAERGLLGDVAGRRVLEVGCRRARSARAGWPAAGRSSRSRWTCPRAARARPRGSTRATGVAVPLVQADARRAAVRRPRRFDLACSAYGAIPFVADSAAVMREVARVLRPGGRWVFSVDPPVPLGASPTTPGRPG